jgi:hypothetical protein
MKNKEKRKRVNQNNINIFNVKIEYTPQEKSNAAYEPQEFVIKVIANNIKDRYKDGETKFSKLLIELK